ncbi:MAG TPA: PAC2 family protein [Acidimicrobiales bacterium]|nr:PAC2 family protein [Acidimicrobiales bacterium]
MTEPVTIYEQPELDEPVLVTMLVGWIDAGAAAATAMSVLENELAARPVATFDSDTFIDYRARRPTMQLRDGVNTDLVWPDTRLMAGRDSAGHDVLLLTGHEPDSNWRLFVERATGMAVEFGTRMMVGLGAYPFATPHSRPSRLSITANSPQVAGSLPYLRNSLDVPAGIEAALERRFAEIGLPALGLWAQVPHYVSNVPYPGASVALLDGLSEVAGVQTEGVALHNDAAAHRTRLDELVKQSDEHVAMVRQLETAYDAASTEPSPTGLLGPLPTGDELAAELERFLRDQGS